MPCSYRKTDGTLCGAEVGNRLNGTPYMFCRTCDSAMNKANYEKRFTKVNVVTPLSICNYVGNMPDTKLPYRCLATSTASGFCVHHAKTGTIAPAPVNTGAPVFTGATVNTSAAPTNIGARNAAKPAPVKVDPKVDSKDPKGDKQVKNQLAKLDESDVETFGVDDVINKLKEPATKPPASKPVEVKEVPAKASKKPKKGEIIEDDETNIETNEVNSEELEDSEADEKAKKAAEKAARKAIKAEVLAKIAAKEAKKKAKEEKKAKDDSSSESSSVKKEDKKAKKAKK